MGPESGGEIFAGTRSYGFENECAVRAKKHSCYVPMFEKIYAMVWRAVDRTTEKKQLHEQSRHDVTLSMRQRQPQNVCTPPLS